MGYSFVYVILKDPGRRAAVRQFVADRLSAIRAQLPADAIVVVGPNASSMGWIFQYALVDQERHPRPARAAAAERERGQAGAAVGRGRRRSRVGRRAGKAVSGRLLPPLLSERGIALHAGHRGGPGRLPGGRRPHDRGHQPRVSASRIGEHRRASTSSSSWSSGATADGQPVHLKDVGYVQVGYDLRRGIADLDGTGEVVGGIAIMEQGRNVLAVTDALQHEARPARAVAARRASRSSPTYDRSALIWDTLTNFFQAIGYELLVVILVIAVALQERAGGRRAGLRAAPRHAVHRAAALGVRPDDQPVLARRSGHRHRRDGRRDHRHRRELHRASSRSGGRSRRPSGMRDHRPARRRR